MIQQEVEPFLDQDFFGEISSQFLLVQAGSVTNSPLPRAPRTVSTQVDSIS